MAFSFPFLRRSVTTLAQTTPVSEQQPQAVPATPSEELFIDRDAPDPGPSDAGLSAISRLAAENLTERGYKDGYTYHDPEVRHHHLEAIKANIRAACERELGAMAGQMQRLDVHIRQLEGAGMDATLAALRTKREQLELLAVNLGEEMLQATGGCGPAELPCATYTDGFNRGYKAYLAAEFLTNSYSAR